MHDHRRVNRLMSQWMYGFVTAFQFLTRIPLPLNVPFNESICKRSTFFYPLVGLVLGLILLAVGHVGLAFFHPAVVAVIVVLSWAVYSGGLHLDGLIDTADALYSNKEKDEMLTIMRDSRIGALGALHAIFVILLKTALLYSMLETDYRSFAFYIVAAMVVSRVMLVFVIALAPYARRSEGLGSFFRNVGRSEMAGSAVIAIVALLITGCILAQETFTTTLVAIGIITLAASLYSVLLARYFKRKFGGLTGDTYGYLVETLEVLLIAVVSVIVT